MFKSIIIIFSIALVVADLSLYNHVKLPQPDPVTGSCLMKCRISQQVCEWFAKKEWPTKMSPQDEFGKPLCCAIYQVMDCGRPYIKDKCTEKEANATYAHLANLQHFLSTNKEACTAYPYDNYHTLCTHD